MPRLRGRSERRRPRFVKNPSSDERPLLVISDLHLGRTDMIASASKLDALVDGASTLIVNGDVAEMVHPEFSRIAHRELDALHRRCLASGTRLVLLAGNHDPEIVARRHLVLAGGDVLLTHGDAVHEALAPWSDAAEVVARRHREVIRSHSESDRETLDVLFEACRKAALAETESPEGMVMPTTPFSALAKPWKVARILGFWMSHARRLDRFANQFQPSARIVIAGHSHRGGVERIGDRTIINTGCFGVPGPALGVIIGADGLEVHRIVGSRRNGTWSMDPRAVHVEPGIHVRPGEIPEGDLPRRHAS